MSYPHSELFGKIRVFPDLGPSCNCFVVWTAHPHCTKRHLPAEQHRFLPRFSVCGTYGIFVGMNLENTHNARHAHLRNIFKPLFPTCQVGVSGFDVVFVLLMLISFSSSPPAQPSSHVTDLTGLAMQSGPSPSSLSNKVHRYVRNKKLRT